MQFSILIVAAGLLNTAAAPAPRKAPPPPPPVEEGADCPTPMASQAFDRSKPLKPQKLNELPDANIYNAVYRTVGDCVSPMIVKYSVSGR